MASKWVRVGVVLVCGMFCCVGGCGRCCSCGLCVGCRYCATDIVGGVVDVYIFSVGAICVVFGVLFARLGMFRFGSMVVCEL